MVSVFSIAGNVARRVRPSGAGFKEPMLLLLVSHSCFLKQNVRAHCSRDVCRPERLRRNVGAVVRMCTGWHIRNNDNDDDGNRRHHHDHCPATNRTTTTQLFHQTDRNQHEDRGAAPAVQRRDQERDRSPADDPLGGRHFAGERQAVCEGVRYDALLHFLPSRCGAVGAAAPNTAAVCKCASCRVVRLLLSLSMLLLSSSLLLLLLLFLLLLFPGGCVVSIFRLRRR